MDVREVTLRGTRLLVVIAPQAIQPVRWQNRITWRVDDHCVEIDASTWHSHHLLRRQFDWSAQPSHLPETEARDVAVALIRQFLLDSEERPAMELAKRPRVSCCVASTPSPATAC